MKKTPLISIIVPIYNTEKYLEECLESLQNQQYKYIEVLMIDDGSTDNSMSICKSFANRDKRFKYFHKENGGMSSARNLALDNAVGDYILYVDSDDMVFENIITECLKVIGDADMVQFGYSHGTGYPGTQLEFRESILDGEEIMKEYLFCGPDVVWNKLYKKSIFESLRFKEGIIHEDTFILPHIMLNAKRVVNINKTLYFYRIRENSTMTSKFSRKKMDIIKCTDNLISLLSGTKYYYVANYRGIVSLINLYSKYLSDNDFISHYSKFVLKKISDYKTNLNKAQKSEVKISWKIQLTLFRLNKRLCAKIVRSV